MTRPDGTPLEVRVGVNTGEALVRLDVDPASGRGFLTGDAVNVAARLQAAAPPGGVVVGALDARLDRQDDRLRGRAAGRSQGQVGAGSRMAGKSPVSRMGIDVDRSALSPLVGREVELDSLRALLDSAITTSSPQFAQLVGEPGIGKTPSGPGTVRPRRRSPRTDHLASEPLPVLRREHPVLGARRRSSELTPASSTPTMR